MYVYIHRERDRSIDRSIDRYIQREIYIYIERKRERYREREIHIYIYICTHLRGDPGAHRELQRTRLITVRIISTY